MRPAILQWKVMLALLAVVIVGASLGGALQSQQPRQTGVQYFSATPGPSNLCAQGHVRGRMYHVLGYKQSQFVFSNYVPSPVPPEFVPGPCPAIHDTRG